jgi:hypothetical protein
LAFALELRDMIWTAAASLRDAAFGSRLPESQRRKRRREGLPPQSKMIRNPCLTWMMLLGLVIGGRFSTVSSPPETASADGADPALQLLLRVAIVGFAPATAANKPRELALAEALSRDGRVALIDPSIVQPALAGIGYDGSINMSKDEARKLGAAIGCDFFIVGKAEALTRSEHENESHEEAYTGVMIVDGRTGALTAFDFISNRASTRESALQALIKTLDARAAGYVDRMIQVRAQARTPQSRDSVSAGSTAGDLVEDVPGEGSPRSAGFKTPEFINRVKPEYAVEAEMADITATVEAMVVFRSNGEVGGIEITRWAGFGLDESSERAIRQLKFKPATRDGNAINVRAMIRYNFRRITEPASKLDQPASKPPDKPERDLRQLFKPTYRRP